MQKVLITGATGNVGSELILHLTGKGLTILAGVRNPREPHPLFDFPDVQPIAFDFTNPATFAAALAGVSTLFLLRPPQLADVPRYFAPLVRASQNAGVSHIVFLSVQGAGTNRWIPHHKIELLVQNSGIPYTFLRPAYFMQNFTTTLLPDIQNKNLIYLPAGKAKFTLVDLRDVGAAGAAVLLQPQAHRNRAYDFTSMEQLDFASMAAILSAAAGKAIRFHSPNLISFFRTKRNEGLSPTPIGIWIMLHYLPRFQSPPVMGNGVADITGKPATSFSQFARDHAHLFRGVQPA